MAKRDLAGYRCEADRTQCPGRGSRREADFDQIFRLVHLHCIPNVKSAEIAKRYPPEARGTERARQRPIGRSPAPINDISGETRRTARGASPIGRQADVLGAVPQQQVRRYQEDKDHKPKHPATRTPAIPHDHRLQQRQEGYRTEPDTGEGNAESKPTLPGEPVSEIKRLPDVRETIDAAADERAER